MPRPYVVINRIFSFFCTFTTIVLTAICFHKFMLNDDLAQIDFPTYHQKPHAIYPALTLCFMGPNIFVDDNLRAQGTGFNASSYFNFLRGLSWVDEMVDIEFDKMTFDIEDYLEGISITSSANQTIYKHCSKNFQHILQNMLGYKCLKEATNYTTKPFYTSFKNHQTKCFSTNVPFDLNNKVQNLRLFIKSTIFPERLHEDFKFENNFGVFVHYPQQFFRSPIHKLYQKVKNDSILSRLNFKVVNMEVLRRRNKQQQQCNDQWNDDDRIIERTIALVGCRPPHWQTTSKEKKCRNSKQMEQYKWIPFVERIPHIPSMNGLDDLPPPCQDILEIHYEYSNTTWNQDEFAGLDVETDFFEVNLAFPSPTYKEIIHVRAYDENSLMSYVGGYIGMFLGLGLLQVPQLLYAAHKKIQVRKQRNTNNISTERRNENGTHHAQCNNLIENNTNHKARIKRSESDIWSTGNEVNRHSSLVNRIDILEAKLEQVLVENRALIQYISNSESIDKRRLQNEVLL